MAQLVDKQFYDDFGGESVDAGKFTRLANIAEDLLYEVCVQKPETAHLESPEYKKAICYQIETLAEQGGTSAIAGKADADTVSVTENLGEYSYSKNYGNGDKSAPMLKLNGIPVSTLAVSQLRKLGLMNRWAYWGVTE